MPDVKDDKARQRLWDSVSDARGHLGECILRANERYFLDREAVAVDLDRFEELLARATRGTWRRPGAAARAGTRARPRPTARRHRLRLGSRRHAPPPRSDRRPPHELGNLRLDNGNPTGALAAAEQAIALDPYNEDAHQVAMHAESVLGLRQAIVERYERLCQELDTRFGLEPEHATGRSTGAFSARRVEKHWGTAEALRPPKNRYSQRFFSGSAVFQRRKNQRRSALRDRLRTVV